MTTTAEGTDVGTALARSVGARAGDLGVRVAVAESLTGGLVSSALAEAPLASAWFAGGIVAYAADVKHGLLGVPNGSVVCADAALAMAVSVSRLLDAEFAVSLTGAGGPDGQDGVPVGTVYLAVAAPTTVRERRLMLHGEPEDICRRAAQNALAALDAALEHAQTARLHAGRAPRPRR